MHYIVAAQKLPCSFSKLLTRHSFTRLWHHGSTRKETFLVYRQRAIASRHHRRHEDWRDERSISDHINLLKLKVAHRSRKSSRWDKG